MTTRQLTTVNVGPFAVAALPQADLIDTMINWPTESAPAVMCHLHVGALNYRGDAEFVAAMNAAEVTYADGMATVLVGRAAGANQLERAGLTDIGHDVISELAKLRARTVRLALLGGSEGLARRAGEVLCESHNCELVFESHGYHQDAEWSDELAKARATNPDIVFVGLGMPQEALWAQRFKSELPNALILPSGGFFGHVVGDEKRAPQWAQKIGMEWLWRVGQAPTRLASRYAKGLISTVVLSIEALRKRR